MSPAELRAVVLAGALTCSIVLLLIPVVRRVALGYGITDDPSRGKVHKVPTPYLGGVAIALTAAGASSLLRGWTGDAALIICGALMVGTVGLLDDLRGLPATPRVMVEIAAAALAAAAGALVQLGPAPLDWALTIAWLVVVTNSFNLLDNMDGAAGAVATVTAIALLVAAALQGQVLVAGLAAVVAGACVGFLAYNWHPARIFMGDAGSLFLGFLLAVIALKLRFPTEHVASVSALLLLTGVPLFDTTLVVLSRVRARLPIHIGGMDHTAHRLLRAGIGPRPIALALGACAAVTSLLGVLVGRGMLSPYLVMPPVALLAGGALIWLLRMPAYAEPTAHRVDRYLQSSG